MDNGVIMLRKTTLAVLALLAMLAAAAGFIVYQSDWFQREYIYPFPYREKVFYYATENEVDPFLIAAVIRTESKFVANARSPKGAMGLMQMMPETGQWVASQVDQEGFNPGMLNDPETSIRFGAWYLASLKKEFKENEILVLAAYNGGRGNVNQWMRQLGWERGFRDIDKIPYRETREYVKKVLFARERYRNLYGR
jgi:soluble lytic murein transglycosylase